MGLVFQGTNLGKGGLDLTPSEERFAPAAPAHLSFVVDDNPETINKALASSSGVGEGFTSNTTTERLPEPGEALLEENVDTMKASEELRPKLLPRETGHDIGMGSPVPLSAEAVGVITRLRNMKVGMRHVAITVFSCSDHRMKTRIGVAGGM